jgi:hypothetical protein
MVDYAAEFAGLLISIFVLTVIHLCVFYLATIFLSDELQKILLLAYICSLFFVITYTINSVGALVRSGIYKFDEHIKKSSNEQ